MEMRGIYAKVDRLEAFVKMVGHHVSFLEDHVLRAERRHGAFSQALRRWGWPGPRGLPSFRNVSISPPLLLPDPGGGGLRKREVKGHVSFLQTGNGVWRPRKGWPRWLVSGSLPQVPLLALSFELRVTACLLIHHLLSACCLLSMVVHWDYIVSRDRPCPPLPSSQPEDVLIDAQRSGGVLLPRHGLASRRPAGLGPGGCPA
ncbi:Breast carcinoma-amplified sequence 4 [Myotis davidii]|uniref:Breast carcinoma-amplified sequence 4 n=1 Tax=Myotis davidii TaxID=225400 RepID=L5M6U1_MYODS|nr:Breast carcinoma-amplified sequence 4 [Myotis davidii]